MLMLSVHAQMCVSWWLRCTGLALIPLALVCALSNILLLLPELQTHFLLDGHVTREATWGSGLWGSFLVRHRARDVSYMWSLQCACVSHVCVCVNHHSVISSSHAAEST